MTHEAIRSDLSRLMNSTYTYRLLSSKRSDKEVAERSTSLMCDIRGITLEQLRQKSKAFEWSLPRTIIAHYLKFNTSMTLTEIGEVIGKDHSTVSAALKRHKDYHVTNSDYTVLYNEFENRV